MINKIHSNSQQKASFGMSRYKNPEVLFTNPRIKPEAMVVISPHIKNKAPNDAFPSMVLSLLPYNDRFPYFIEAKVTEETPAPGGLLGKIKKFLNPKAGEGEVVRAIYYTDDPIGSFKDLAKKGAEKLGLVEKPEPRSSAVDIAAKRRIFRNA